MKNKRKLRNILIVCGLISLVLAPFATYFLTPALVEMHCSGRREFLCGLGEGPIYAAVIFIGLLLVGTMFIAIATGIQVKEKKSVH